ncbi:mechanosensitive ion channel protein [Actibacterium pelagium]|uniref:Small-conductance mechanosensitive channel n=2 Tax=Actibacterium pelagium TaxID=2029103 RepID=A0A917EJM7_9RHOB|nr:mechanosensitive ion channel protein [Actibacterium pelagium]
MDTIVEILINIGYALAIGLGAIWASGFAKKKIEQLGTKHQELDVTLMRFFGSVARYAIIVLAGIFILGRFGIETTSLAALIGAAGLAIGLALQGTLSNVAAGVMLVGFRPFKVGDYIEAGGHAGTVSAITLFTTELTTPDNVQIILPNGDVFGAPITNFSYHDTRRVDFVFGVSYSSDLKLAEDTIRACIKADARAHTDPEPLVKVSNLAGSSVDFTVRVWCDRTEYWNLKFDLTRAVKEAFDANNIDIPFPTQMVIHQNEYSPE